MNARQDQRLMYTWAALGLIVVFGLIYHHATLAPVQNSVEQLQAQVQQARSAAEANAAIAEDLRTRTNVLERQLNNSISAITQDISEREQRSLSQIRGLEGKLGEVQKQSDELKNKIDLNIQSEDFSALVDDALQSVVSIFTDTGSGSGAIVGQEGYIVTNYHVIEGISQGAVRTYDGQVYPVRIVATDPTRDLALLKIEADESLRALAFEQPENVKPGMRVVALGSPAGLEFTVTEGIVSAVGRGRESTGVPYVQTDVPINPGNSGGPLLDIRGNIVGINTFKARGYEGIGFAIQSDEVEQFVKAAILRDEQENVQLSAP